MFFIACVGAPVSASTICSIFMKRDPLTSTLLAWGASESAATTSAAVAKRRAAPKADAKLAAEKDKAVAAKQDAKSERAEAAKRDEMAKY